MQDLPEDFPLGTFICVRGNKYIIEVECTDYEECVATLHGELINCGTCPDVEITVTPADVCINGRRTVHIQADVVSAVDANYTWFFGTDEDNQSGEDSQAGDGENNFWLPPPNSNGIRVVEVDHVYEATNDEPRTITVSFKTTSGPSSLCIAQKSFTLDPCECDLTVSLRVSNQEGRMFSTRECLPPGDYVVQVISPVADDIDYSWFVNGEEADNSQSNSSFNFSILAGEEKRIYVVVEQGACCGSDGVTITGCEDCSSFDAQLRVLNNSGQNVTDEDCLQPGNYTVQIMAPTGGGNTSYASS